MAATPYPTDYVYAGNAVALTLLTAVSDGGGDLTLTVNEETAAKGWPSLGAGQRLVIVVGRGTAYETKYAVKTITSSAAGSTLVVDSADKTFDNTPVTAAPAGTEVEHCWSATEASLANDHMRTKQAHGSDGDLVDQNTAQLLSNKTVMTPTASGHPTTKAYVDAADALALPKAGGTMSGNINANGNKVTGLAAASSNGDAVRYEQLAATDASVAALGTWTAWTPSLTSSGTTPTFANVTDESRYTQIGKTVTGKGQVTITAVGTGTYRLPLPVTPKSTATAARRIGFIQIDGGGRVGHYSLEQANGATYCLGVEVGQITPVAYIDATSAGYYLAYGSPVRLSWDFTYEAA